jgi:hypothetical protein
MCISYDISKIEISGNKKLPRKRKLEWGKESQLNRSLGATGR